MRKPSWGLGGAYALLALAVATTALAFATLRVINDPHIAGAGPGYRYYTLGVQRSSGPDFALNTPLIELMAGKWPPGLDGVGMLPQTVAFSSSARHQSTPTFQAELVAGTYLQAMHVAPLAGRLLTLADVRNGRKVVVLNAKLARHLFGSVQAAVGQRLADTSGLALKGLSLQVVGVVSVGAGRDRHCLGSVDRSLAGYPVHISFWCSGISLRPANLDRSGRAAAGRVPSCAFPGPSGGPRRARAEPAQSLHEL